METTQHTNNSKLYDQLTPTKLEELSHQSFTENLGWIIDEALDDVHYHQEATTTLQDWDYWHGYSRAVLELYPLILKLAQAEQIRRNRQERKERHLRQEALTHYLQEFRPKK